MLRRVYCLVLSFTWHLITKRFEKDKNKTVPIELRQDTISLQCRDILQSSARSVGLQGPGCGGAPPPPLFLDQIEAQRAKKNSALSPAPYSELLGALDSETRTNENEDFLNTEYCSRVNQRHFGGKTRQPSFYYEF